MHHLTKVRLTEADWNKLKEISRKAVGKGPGSHGWDHVRRVYELCLKIGRKEKADLSVLGLAALLHDIGRQEEKASKGGGSVMPGSAPQSLGNPGPPEPFPGYPPGGYSLYSQSPL